MVIVANAADADSAALAAHYAAVRGVPSANIVVLPLPTTETVTWPVFAAEIFNPLLNELLARKWIEGPVSSQPDEYGRVQTTAHAHRISYLVLIRGVPLHIAHHPAWAPRTPPAGINPALNTNEASVDGELALLAGSPSGETVPVNALIPNPLYGKSAPSGLLAAAVIRVTRLDGPTPAAVREMIDGAVSAERAGLAGRAYVDLGGAYPQGNAWLESVARQIDATGFDLAVDRAPTTLGPLARCDAPALYFGWYAENADGPFIGPGFRFPQGAVAVHIHSYSAQTLRSATAHWCGPLIARGAAATLGNVAEPYLEWSHHLDLFVDALVRGHTFGEAAYYALPALSWQEVAVGDPLYRPFARPFAEQWANRAHLPAELQPYVAFRQARLVARAGDKAEALRLLRQSFREAPSVAGGLAVAEMARDVEGREAAVRELAFLGMLKRFPVHDAGLVRAAASLLIDCGAADQAMSLYDKLLANPLPGDMEALLLEDGIRAAARAALPGRADGWYVRLSRLRAGRNPAGE